jgi:hypothetical protein
MAIALLESLSQSFSDFNIKSLSLPSLHAALNFHRNEYLGNMTKVRLYHARAIDCNQNCDDIFAQLTRRMTVNETSSSHHGYESMLKVNQKGNGAQVADSVMEESQSTKEEN